MSRREPRSERRRAENGEPATRGSGRGARCNSPRRYLGRGATDRPDAKLLARDARDGHLRGGGPGLPRGRRGAGHGPRTKWAHVGWGDAVGAEHRDSLGRDRNDPDPRGGRALRLRLRRDKKSPLREDGPRLGRRVTMTPVVKPVKRPVDPLPRRYMDPLHTCRWPLATLDVEFPRPGCGKRSTRPRPLPAPTQEGRPRGEGRRAAPQPPQAADDGSPRRGRGRPRATTVGGRGTRIVGRLLEPQSRWSLRRVQMAASDPEVWVPALGPTLQSDWDWDWGVQGSEGG